MNVSGSSDTPYPTGALNDTGNQQNADILWRSAKTNLPTGVLFGTFTKDDGPFLIEGSIIIPSGQTLEFGPACTVLVAGTYTTITIFGQLIAHGTAEKPVVFMSAKNKPERWDWDRIYCRSRNRSLFEHCIIQHSNYGVYVENGSVSIQNSLFTKNSLSGVVVKNGDATIRATTFEGGHAVAISLLSHAEVFADSLAIKNNIAGMYCAGKSTLKMNGGIISQNVNGIIASGESMVEILGTEIVHNRNGVISEVQIPPPMKEMVYANGIDVTVVPADSLTMMVKEPLPVVSVVVPVGGTPTKTASDFKSGFSALNTPQEPTVSFIGNVTFGVTWYNPETNPHPIDIDTSYSYIRRSDSTMDTIQKISNVVNYQTKYPGEESSKQFRGFQPEMQFFANGKRGETDINLLMDLYSNQWLSTANYFGKNMFNLTMNYTDHSLVLGDFLESGSETSITGRQITGIRYTGKKFDMGRGEKRFEFNLAAGETEIAKDSGDHEIFVYNQSVDTGMSKRQQITYITEALFKPTRTSSIGAKGIIAHDQHSKPLFRKALSDPAQLDAIVAQTGVFTGNMFLLNQKLEVYAEIDLGSADTLSDSAAEEIAWYNPEIQKAFPKVLSLFNPADFVEHAAGTIGARGTLREYEGSIRYLQVAPKYFSAGDPYLITWRKNVLSTVSHTLSEKVVLDGEFEFDRSIVPGADDQSDPSITDLAIGSLDATYEMGDGLPSFSAHYILQHKKNDARESIINEDTTYSEAYHDLEISNKLALEGKQSFSNGMAYSVRYQLLWDNDYADHPNTFLDDEGDRFHNVVSGWYSFKYKKLFKNKINFRFATKHENRDSLRAYQWKCSDQLSFQILPRRLSCSVIGEYSYKSEKEFDGLDWADPRATLFYNAELELRYSLSARLSSSLMGKYEKSRDELTGSTENYRTKIAGFHVTYLF